MLLHGLRSQDLWVRCCRDSSHGSACGPVHSHRGAAKEAVAGAGAMYGHVGAARHRRDHFALAMEGLMEMVETVQKPQATETPAISLGMGLASD